MFHQKSRYLDGKTCMNWIPVFYNLAKRGVKVDSRYPRCGLAHELVSHCLWKCPEVKRVWENCSYYDKINMKDV